MAGTTQGRRGELMAAVSRDTAGDPRPAPGDGAARDNGFGVLRLVFAALVVLAHSSELKYGDRAHEPLTLLFHTISFGDLAVDSFFVVSGYLISESWLRSTSAGAYLLRRVARLWPGYLVNYALCVLVVAPLAGVVWVAGAGPRASVVLGAVLLRMPDAGAVFAGQPWPALNGASWTIVREFQCYVLVAMLGLGGLLGRRGVIAGVTLAAAIETALLWVPGPPPPIAPHVFNLFTTPGLVDAAVDVLVPNIRLVAVFMVGVCFRLFAGQLRFRPDLALLAAAFLLVALRIGPVADAAWALAGGYLILYAATRSAGTVLARINARNDISYGLYLYAWPVEMLLYRAWPGLPVAAAGVLTVGLAAALGWASWLLVERPALRAARRWRAAGNARRVPIAVPAVA